MGRALVLCVVAALAGCVTITSSSIGTFAGVMPCGDCAGILTELRLYAEQGRPTRFELTETYLGSRDGDRSIGTAGQWDTVNNAGATVVRLDLGSVSTRRNFLRVGGDELRRLDASLREIPSAVPHSLHRVSELPAVTLLETESGRTIEVEPGQRVFVVLATNRATGFDWMIESSGTGLLTTLGAPIYARGAALGSEGTEMWFFAAALKGKQELRFQYRRPFEQGAPAAKAVSFTVVVR